MPTDSYSLTLHTTMQNIADTENSTRPLNMACQEYNGTMHCKYLLKCYSAFK